MLDLRVATQRLDHAAGIVLEELHALVSYVPSVMVVGAVCRDALHAALGMTEQLSATGDLDLALGVEGWEPYETLTAKLDRITGSGSRIRYRVAGTVVDLVPFGDVEQPAGEVRLPDRGDELSVFGFQEVFASAEPIALASGAIVRLPTPAGFTALKLKAWVDRRAYHESKDGKDLATAMSWYQRAPAILDRLYEPADSDRAARGVLEAVDFDPELGAVMLLIRDAMTAIGPTRHEELRELWQTVDDDLLSTDLQTRRARPRARRQDGTDPRVMAIRAVISGPSLD